VHKQNTIFYLQRFETLLNLSLHALQYNNENTLILKIVGPARNSPASYNFINTLDILWQIRNMVIA